MANVQPIEWLLLTFTLVGMAIHIRRVWKATKEQFRVITERVNGIYGFSVKMNAVDEWLRLIKQIFLMVATILFMLASMKRIGPMSPEGSMGRMFMMGISALLTLKSVINEWADMRIRQMDRDQQRRRGDNQ